MEQVVELFALACSDPENDGRPISHWTTRELADEMIKQKIVKSISPRHVGRLLQEAEIKPHQSRYWLTPPPDDEFDAKVKRITDLYRTAVEVANQENALSVSMTELTQLSQAIASQFYMKNIGMVGRLSC